MDVGTLKTASGYLIATALTTIGLSTIVDPVARSKNFGVAARPEDKAMIALLKPMGARDMALGITIGLFVFKGDLKNAGLVTLIALITPAVDAWAAWTFNGRLKEAWPHVIGGVAVGLVGLWLSG